MESDILNELFDLINEEENNGDKYTVSQLINIIKNSDKYDVFLEAMADVRRELFVDDEVHGISHNERVCLLACVIAIKEGLDARSLRILLEAAKYHDIGRKDRSGPTGEHGIRSARIIEEKRADLVPDFNDEEVRILKALAIGHNTADKKMEDVIRENGVYDVPHAKKLLTILKDADALDRVRLKRFGKLREEFLRTETSKELVPVATALYEKYNETRELIKYNRESVQRKFDSNLFGLDTYDVIEDDEYYYVFRTLNEDNEEELDDDNVEHLRTSRERAEERGEEVRYSSSSELSLEEINDNIKYAKANKNTNCISFSTNANVSLDYRNDRFVMMKIPKDELGNLVVSGRYMLEEIDKMVIAKIDELLVDEEANKEILSLISQINEAGSSGEIKNVVARTYKGVKKTNEKYTGSNNSMLTKNAVMNRFANKQYLSEKKQLEYNRLIAKLTVLETRGVLRNILPTHLTNTGLISSIGVAFSSSEMVHYRDVPKTSLIEVSKENMEIFAILQQASQIPGINKKEIEDLKRDFLFAVQNGYDIRVQNNRVVYTNGKHRIDIGDITDFVGLFESEDIEPITTVQDAYDTLRLVPDLPRVLPYSKGNAAIEFARKLAVAKLKSDDYWKILKKVSPGIDNLAKTASKSTINIHSDIISRINNSGVQISESVNIDIPMLNARRLFKQDEIRDIFDKINSLRPDELERLANGDIEIIKNGLFRDVLIGKEYPGGEKEYYAELIAEELDLTKVYTYLKPGSKKIGQVKLALKETLEKVDAKKLYLSLLNIGIKERDIPSYITNLILDDGIGKDIESFEDLVSRNNLEEILSEYKNNLKERVSGYRLNMFMGIRDNDYVVPKTDIRLRDYQKEAYDNLGKIYAKGKRFAGVKLPTGAGKSFVAMAEMMRRANQNMVYFAPQEEILSQVQRHIVKYVLGKEILTEEHVLQMVDMSRKERESFLKNKIYNPSVNVNKWLNTLKNDSLPVEERKKIIARLLPRKNDRDDDVMAAIHVKFPNLQMECYQSLTAKKYEELKSKKIDFFIFDELHRTGAEKWGERLEELLEIQNDADILGITATPVRDADNRDMMKAMAEKYGRYTAEEIKNKEYYAAEMSLIDAMQRKLVVEPIIVPFNRSLKNLSEYEEIRDAVAELEETKRDPKLLEKLKFNLSEMDKIIESGATSEATTMDKLEGIDDVLAANIPESKKNGKFIVFLPHRTKEYKDKDTETYVRDKIAETEKYFGKISESIMSSYLLSNREGGDKENARVIAEFESIQDDRLKLLYAIDKLNEGVHVDGISGEVMLRPIGAGSNILYFQQIGRVIYAIDPDNPPSEDDIPIIFDVYDNYIARDLDREANYTTTISDLSNLQEIINWINKHETLPEIDSPDRSEVGRAVALRKIQAKYAKYLDGINNPNLNESEIYEIEKILELAKSINLFEIEFSDVDLEQVEKDFRVRTFEVTGEPKKFLEIYEDSKKAINRSELKSKASAHTKIKEGIAIFKTLSSYGLAITDESFEEIDPYKENIDLLDYISANFDQETTRAILKELKISAVDAEYIDAYKTFDYLRDAFMSKDNSVRKHFGYYDLVDLRKCGIFKKDGEYIPIINNGGFVLKEDEFGDGFKSPSVFTGMNIMTGTKYDEEGFDIDGYDSDGYNRQGYDRTGCDREGFRLGDIYNKYGFDRKGINRDTGTNLDEYGFDILGNFWELNPEIGVRENTHEIINEYNFDRDGWYYEYDDEGNLVVKGKVDGFGFKLGDTENEEGFLRNLNHKATGKPWDHYGFDINKIYWKVDKLRPNERICTNSEFNEYNFKRDEYYYEKDEDGNWKRIGKTDRLGFKFSDIYNDRGFSRKGIHNVTKQPWDENGFGMDGMYWALDETFPGRRVNTGTPYNEYGFAADTHFYKQDADGNWQDMGLADDFGFEFAAEYSYFGFGRNGIHKDTGLYWDQNGFGMDKKYWRVNPKDPNDRIKTDSYLDEYEFNIRRRYCEYDDEGVLHEFGVRDRDGFTAGENGINQRGFYRNKKHFETGLLFDRYFFDIDGNYWEADPQDPTDKKKRKKTNKKFDEYGKDANGNAAEGVEQRDEDALGFRRGSDWNNAGFNRAGINKHTGKPWDLKFFDINGYYWKENPDHKDGELERVKTDKMFNEKNVDRAGYFCIFDQKTKSTVRLNKYCDKFRRMQKHQEGSAALLRDDVYQFADGAYDKKGIWWNYNAEKGIYENTGSRFHPIYKWDEAGCDENGKIICHDLYGFRPDKKHTNGTFFNDRGFDCNYIHRKTKEPYDEEGFGIDEYYWEIDKSNPNRRIKTENKFNEYGVTFDGETDQDIHGYDDIGMLKGELHVNNDFRVKPKPRYIEGYGSNGKKEFRETPNGYYYMDSDFYFNPNTGLDYKGFNKNGININGETKNGITEKEYFILAPNSDEFFKTYDEDEYRETAYENDYYEDSRGNKKRRTLEERRANLDSIYASDYMRDEISYFKTRYRSDKIVRQEALQAIRDTWDVGVFDDDDAIDPWVFEEEYEFEEEWQDYVRREEYLKKRLKDKVVLDVHFFDEDGVYYTQTYVAGNIAVEPTTRTYDENFFNKDGFYCDVDEETGNVFVTENKINPYGFDQNGFYHDPDGKVVSIYDKEGYDIRGYNRYGFNREGKTITKEDINKYGFKADGTFKNTGVKHSKLGFTIDGKNIYTGTYRDMFGRTISSDCELPDPYMIVNKEKNLNMYGLNPENGKNIFGFIDPTIRFARYYWGSVLEDGRDPDEVIQALANCYEIPVEEMEMLAEQKLFIAMQGYPKLREEKQAFFEKGRETIGKNYDMNIRLMEASKRRKLKKVEELKSIPDDTGAGIDDDL